MTAAIVPIDIEARKRERMIEVWNYFAEAGVCASCCAEVGFYVVERENGNPSYTMNTERIKACRNRGLSGRRGVGLTCEEAVKASGFRWPKREK